MTFIKMNISEYKNLIKNEIKKTNKYHAKRCEVDGFNFDSLAEADYYKILKWKVKFNEISFFIRQTAFHLPGNTRLVSDFVVFNKDGSFKVIDVKGDKPTKEWIVKRKMVEALYPIKIEIIKKKEVDFLKKRYLT